jgi:hypothetical protein
LWHTNHFENKKAKKEIKIIKILQFLLPFFETLRFGSTPRKIYPAHWLRDTDLTYIPFHRTSPSMRPLMKHILDKVSSEWI